MAGVRLPEVCPVEDADRSTVGRALGDAFYGTDHWTAVFPDPDVRRHKLRQMFTGTVKLTAAAGGITERTRGFEAAAMWLPPGRKIGLWPMVTSGFASARFAITPPFPNLLRMTRMFRQFEETHEEHAPEPHWYLMALGVEPAHQRGAYGPALVIHGIERADRDDVPIYLETESGPNVAFYRKLGFDVLDEIVVEAYDLPFTLLIRPPGRDRPWES